jgi:hypothetical protein
MHYYIHIKIVGFEVLTAVSKKMAVFWVVAPCSLAKFTNVSEVLAASIIRAMSTDYTALLKFSIYTVYCRY